MTSKRFFTCALLLFLGSPLFAVTGRLRGAVKDTEGKPIEKVLITIELQGEITQKYTAHTNAKGEYIHIGVNPGKYRITPTKDGYKPVDYGYVDLQISYSDKPVVADFVLQKIGTEQPVAKPAEQEESEQAKAARAGASLLKEGKADEAIVQLQKALELDPNLASVHYNLALAYERKDQREQALKQLEEAIRLKPDFGEAYTAVGDLNMQQKKFETAAEAYTKAGELLPQSYPVFYNLGVAYSNAGKYVEAEAAYRKATELNPKEPIAHYQLGMALLGQSKNGEARAEFQKYLELNPNAADKQEVLDLIQTLQ
ncbi:MAG TPA: tetratricopeptide repeat protein [Acidobacteriota bacterium]